MTRFPDSRSRVASGVKSLSLETMANPSTLPEYSRSIASMISAESVAFLPDVYANCCCGEMALPRSTSRQPVRCGLVQSP